MTTGWEWIDEFERKGSALPQEFIDLSEHRKDCDDCHVVDLCPTGDRLEQAAQTATVLNLERDLAAKSAAVEADWTVHGLCSGRGCSGCKNTGISWACPKCGGAVESDDGRWQHIDGSSGDCLWEERYNNPYPEKIASAGDTTYPFAENETPNIAPQSRGTDPWVDQGDTGNPEHNPNLQKKLKRKMITDEQLTGPTEVNYPGNGLMSQSSMTFDKCHACYGTGQCTDGACEEENHPNKVHLCMACKGSGIETNFVCDNCGSERHQRTPEGYVCRTCGHPKEALESLRAEAAWGRQKKDPVYRFSTDDESHVVFMNDRGNTTEDGCTGCGWKPNDIRPHTDADFVDCYRCKGTGEQDVYKSDKKSPCYNCKNSPVKGKELPDSFTLSGADKLQQAADHIRRATPKSPERQAMEDHFADSHGQQIGSNYDNAMRGRAFAEYFINSDVLNKMHEKLHVRPKCDICNGSGKCQDDIRLALGHDGGYGPGSPEAATMGEHEQIKRLKSHGLCATNGATTVGSCHACGGDGRQGEPAGHTHEGIKTAARLPEVEALTAHRDGCSECDFLDLCPEGERLEAAAQVAAAAKIREDIERKTSSNEVYPCWACGGKGEFEKSPTTDQFGTTCDICHGSGLNRYDGSKLMECDYCHGPDATRTPGQCDHCGDKGVIPEGMAYACQDCGHDEHAHEDDANNCTECGCVYWKNHRTEPRPSERQTKQAALDGDHEHDAPDDSMNCRQCGGGFYDYRHKGLSWYPENLIKQVPGAHPCILCKGDNPNCLACKGSGLTLDERWQRFQTGKVASKGPKITFVQGDITQQDTDAIVNAANESLLGGGGVDGAIHRAAGPSVLEECKKIRATTHPDGLKAGEAVVTSGGNLRAKYIIHAVGPRYTGRKPGDRDPAPDSFQSPEAHPNPEEALRSAHTESLKRADEVGAQSVSFPAISTGIFGYPIDEASKVAVDAVRNAKTNVKEVRFVSFDDKTHAAYSAQDKKPWYRRGQSKGQTATEQMWAQIKQYRATHTLEYGRCFCMAKATDVPNRDCWGCAGSGLSKLRFTPCNDETCPICPSTKKQAQTWTQSVDPPMEQGKRKMGPPHLNDGETHVLEDRMRAPEGLDIKKWKTVKTFPGDKSFADHPQNQDHVDMGQVVGKATPCPMCPGTGLLRGDICPKCNGHGEIGELDVCLTCAGDGTAKWCDTHKTIGGGNQDHCRGVDRAYEGEHACVFLNPVGTCGICKGTGLRRYAAKRVTNMDKIKNYLLKVGETDTHDATGGTASHTCQACGKRHSDVSFDTDPDPMWRVDGSRGTEIDAENKAYWIPKDRKQSLMYSPAASLHTWGNSDGPGETIHQEGFDEPATPFHIKVLWNPYMHHRDYATMNLLHEAGHYMQAKTDWPTFHEHSLAGALHESDFERDAFEKGMDVAKAAGVRVTPNMKQQWKWSVGGEHLAEKSKFVKELSVCSWCEGSGTNPVCAYCKGAGPSNCFGCGGWSPGINPRVDQTCQVCKGSGIMSTLTVGSVTNNPKNIWINCHYCDGTGTERVCGACGGWGGTGPIDDDKTCGVCKGSGEGDQPQKCRNCHGSGLQVAWNPASNPDDRWTLQDNSFPPKSGVRATKEPMEYMVCDGCDGRGCGRCKYTGLEKDFVLCPDCQQRHDPTEHCPLPDKLTDEEGVCRHCQRRILYDENHGWVDPEATGDDRMWRETCDEHEDDIRAEHEPEGKDPHVGTKQAGWEWIDEFKKDSITHRVEVKDELIKCELCGGTGRTTNCIKCHGGSEYYEGDPNLPGTGCDVCGRLGYGPERMCRSCKGSGIAHSQDIEAFLREAGIEKTAIDPAYKYPKSPYDCKGCDRPVWEEPTEKCPVSGLGPGQAHLHKVIPDDTLNDIRSVMQMGRDQNLGKPQPHHEPFRIRMDGKDYQAHSACRGQGCAKCHNSGLVRSEGPMSNPEHGSIELGKTSDGERVIAHLELGPAQQIGHRQTTDHRKTTEDDLDFSLTGDILQKGWRPGWHNYGGGAIGGTFSKRIMTPAPGITRDLIKKIDGFDSYHLNGMASHCDHQDWQWKCSNCGTENNPYPNRPRKTAAKGDPACQKCKGSGIVSDIPHDDDPRWRDPNWKVEEEYQACPDCQGKSTIHLKFKPGQSVILNTALETNLPVTVTKSEVESNLPSYVVEDAKGNTWRARDRHLKRPPRQKKAQKRPSIPDSSQCVCRGSGLTDLCGTCGGQGTVFTFPEECPECKGSGRTEYRTCEWCEGTGTRKYAMFDYDPVRDVSPSTKSAPAPSAQGSGGDPWPDQGDNGTAPPRPGWIRDPKLKKWVRDEQLTYPDVGPTFPGVTDINKVGAFWNKKPTEPEEPETPPGTYADPKASPCMYCAGTGINLNSGTRCPPCKGSGLFYRSGIVFPTMEDLQSHMSVQGYGGHWRDVKRTDPDMSKETMEGWHEELHLRGLAGGKPMKHTHDINKVGQISRCERCKGEGCIECNQSGLRSDNIFAGNYFCQDCNGTGKCAFEGHNDPDGCAECLDGKCAYCDGKGYWYRPVMPGDPQKTAANYRYHVKPKPDAMVETGTYDACDYCSGRGTWTPYGKSEPVKCEECRGSGITRNELEGGVHPDQKTPVEPHGIWDRQEKRWVDSFGSPSDEYWASTKGTASMRAKELNERLRGGLRVGANNKVFYCHECGGSGQVPDTSADYHMERNLDEDGKWNGGLIPKWNKMDKCHECNGSGLAEVWADRVCHDCGFQWMDADHDSFEGWSDRDEGDETDEVVHCSECKGSGQSYGKRCGTCKGSGLEPERIPPTHEGMCPSCESTNVQEVPENTIKKEGHKPGESDPDFLACTMCDGDPSTAYHKKSFGGGPLTCVQCKGTGILSSTPYNHTFRMLKDEGFPVRDMSGDYGKGFEIEYNGMKKPVTRGDTNEAGLQFGHGDDGWYARAYRGDPGGSRSDIEGPGDPDTYHNGRNEVDGHVICEGCDGTGHGWHLGDGKVIEDTGVACGSCKGSGLEHTLDRYDDFDPHALVEFVHKMHDRYKDEFGGLPSEEAPEGHNGHLRTAAPEDTPCEWCEGEGELPSCQECQENCTPGTGYTKCSACKGKGSRSDGSRCGPCKGAGMSFIPGSCHCAYCDEDGPYVSCPFCDGSGRTARIGKVAQIPYFRIVGFAYDADTHCVSCTRKRFNNLDDQGAQGETQPGYYECLACHGKGEHGTPGEKPRTCQNCKGSGLNFSNGTPEDSEGNPIHPMFAGEDHDSPFTCDDCKEAICATCGYDGVDKANGTGRVTCDDCEGTGKRFGQTCGACDGSGHHNNVWECGNCKTRTQFDRYDNNFKYFGQAFPQPVGMHEGDNGIDDPKSDADKSKIRDVIPGTQRSAPGNNVWNVSIDNLPKTGAGDRAQIDPAAFCPKCRGSGNYVKGKRKGERCDECKGSGLLLNAVRYCEPHRSAWPEGAETCVWEQNWGEDRPGHSPCKPGANWVATAQLNVSIDNLPKTGGNNDIGLCGRCEGKGCYACNNSGIRSVPSDLHPIHKHLLIDHGDVDDLGQLYSMNEQELDDTHKDWHEQEEEDYEPEEREGLVHRYKKIGQLVHQNENMVPTDDSQDAEEPAEPQPTDTQLHVVRDHPRIIDKVEDPEIEGIHLEDHFEGWNTHNPETLRVASADDKEWQPCLACQGDSPIVDQDHCRICKGAGIVPLDMEYPF